MSVVCWRSSNSKQNMQISYFLKKNNNNKVKVK
jgi:hypothetical protein